MFFLRERERARADYMSVLQYDCTYSSAVVALLVSSSAAQCLHDRIYEYAATESLSQYSRYPARPQSHQRSRCPFHDDPCRLLCRLCRDTPSSQKQQYNCKQFILFPLAVAFPSQLFPYTVPYIGISLKWPKGQESVRQRTDKNTTRCSQWVFFFGL